MLRQNPSAELFLSIEKHAGVLDNCFGARCPYIQARSDDGTTARPTAAATALREASRHARPRAALHDSVGNGAETGARRRGNKQTKRAGRKLPPDWAAQEFLDFYGITNTLARPNNSAWVYAETIYFANFRDVRRPSGCHFTGAIACGAVPSTLRWDTACQCRRSSSQRGVRRAKNALHGCPASTLTQGSWCV